MKAERFQTFQKIVGNFLNFLIDTVITKNWIEIVGSVLSVTE